MSFTSVSTLKAALAANCVRRIYVKPLSENDNTKQQIYFGPNLSSLQQLPIVRVYSDQSGEGSILKAEIRFGWLQQSGRVNWASDPKLIFYPQYPEVRLSGILRGATGAPSEHMQPVPKELRKGKGPDGRMLVLGTTREGSIVAYLAPAGSALANELGDLIQARRAEQVGVFYQLSDESGDSKSRLLNELRRVASLGPVNACRLLAGEMVGCPAINPNARGYTLEALLGIEPNGRHEPDFDGWELKTVGKGKVTLLTTEPDGGVYGAEGPKAFLRRFGAVSNGKLRFVGRHVVDEQAQKTGLTLSLPGFDSINGKLHDPARGIELCDQIGEVAASWSYAKLTQRWAQKHSRSAYVSCTMIGDAFEFGPDVTLCEGTDIELLLSAFGRRKAYYDPGTSYAEASATARELLKRRNQFRISVRDKADLYRQSEKLNLRA